MARNIWPQTLPLELMTPEVLVPALVWVRARFGSHYSLKVLKPPPELQNLCKRGMESDKASGAGLNPKP